MPFLPISKQDMKDRGIDQLDSRAMIMLIIRHLV